MPCCNCHLTGKNGLEQEKPKNEIQCNLSHTVWFSLREFRRCWQSQRAVSWISGHSCATKSGNVSGIQHWKEPIGHLFRCSCRKSLYFEQCDDIRPHYVSRTEQRWSRLQYQRWHCIVYNLEKASLIAQRLIYDHMHAKEVGTHDIVLTDKLRRFSLASSSKRKQTLAENKI